jgi:hypothetical protein
MTDQAHEPVKEKLYITDAELIRWLGVPEKVARRAIRVLDANHRQSGFPQKQAIWGDRRYKPALQAYFDAHGGLDSGIGAARLIPENRDRTRLPRRHLAVASSGGSHG